MSYSTRSSKALVFGLIALLMGYLLLRSQAPVVASVGDYLAVPIALGGATLARQKRETVGIREPREDRERARLKWSYIIAAIGGLLGLGALVALIATFLGDKPSFYWLVAAGLMALAAVNREIADWLYEPFVIRTTSRPYGS